MFPRYKEILCNMKAPNNKFADYKELNTVPNVPQYLFSGSAQ